MYKYERRLPNVTEVVFIDSPMTLVPSDTLAMAFIIPAAVVGSSLALAMLLYVSRRSVNDVTRAVDASATRRNQAFLWMSRCSKYNLLLTPVSSFSG